MKSILTTTAAVLALASPALAQTAMDTDGDGNVSLEELQAAFPDMTADGFTAMDTDADGVLSAAEIQAAQDAGVLPS
ncbi:MAG: EF-hand domain-containing protein [Pseudomonadota bacterium]